MYLIAYDPILRCMERSGYPPWLCARRAENDAEPDDESGGEDEDGQL